MVWFDICPVEESDMPELAAIEKYESMLCGWSENSLRSEFHKNGVIMLKAVLRENGEIIGFITAEKVLDECNINNVAVKKEYRRNGIATGLLKALEAEFQDVVKHYLLEVRVGNEAAVALYKSLDFEIVGKRPDFYDTPVEDAFAMVKSLTYVG